MFKSRTKKILAISLIMISLSITSYAYFYMSTITLPRGGGIWTSTVDRSATGGTQTTKAIKPPHNVFGRIALSDGSYTPLNGGKWGKHEKDVTTTQSHNTGVKAGTALRCQFRTANTNLLTTRATIGYEP